MRLTLLIISFISICGFSQVEVIDSNYFDQELFKKYVLEEVNLVRKRKRADDLIYDSSLKDAAQNHADYMAQNRVVTHNQKKKSHRQPIDRVRFFGGTHGSVGENVQMIHLDQEIKSSKGRLTYKKLAKEAVEVWRKSADHYANMVNKDFSVMELGLAINDGYLLMCQVLGSPPFEERYEFARGDALEVFDGKECGNCKRTKKKIFSDEASMGWYSVSNDSIYWWNTKYQLKYKRFSKKTNTYRRVKRKNNLKPLFKAKGVISFDVIHNEQFECNGNSQYHNSPYHDGYYLNYVDKKKIKTKNISTNPGLIKFYVGQKPAFADTFFQVDFNLNKKKRPCLHSATVYVRPDHLLPVEYYYIDKPKIKEGGNLLVSDSLEIKVPFKRNQTDEDSTIFQPLITTLDSLMKSAENVDNRKIVTVSFTGVASIEGSEKANKKLFIKRGKLVEGYLRRYYPNLPFKSEFYENFDDFRSGLASVGYKDLVGFSDDSLRMFANDHRNEKEVSELLDETRFSSVTIVWEDEIIVQDGAYGLSVQRVRDLINDRNIGELTPLYQLLSNKALDGDTAIASDLLAVDIPEEPEFGYIQSCRWILGVHLEGKRPTDEDLKWLRKNKAIMGNGQLLERQLLFNTYYHSQELDIYDFDSLITTVKGKKFRAWIESLKMIYDVQNGYLAHQIATPMLLTNVLKKKFDLRQTYLICQHLIEWGYTAEPYILLSKFARRPNQLPKLYKQYIKLGFFLGQFDNKKEWKKIKIAINNLTESNPKEYCELFKWFQMGVRALEKEEVAEKFCEVCRE